MEKNRIMTKAAFLLSLLAAAAVLPSCEREAIDGTVSAQEDNVSALRFTPGIASLPRISEEPATRATLINENGTEASLSTDAEFYVMGWDVTKTGGEETLTPVTTAFEKVKYVVGSETSHVNMWLPVDGSGKIIEHRWKSEEKKLFYAYSNVPSSGSVTLDQTDSDSPVLKVACTLADQTDVLMGHYKGDGRTGTKMTGTASVEFHHPLAAVEFEVGTITAPKDSFKITGIAMEGLYTEGTASMDTTGAITWSACSGEGSVSQTVTTMPASGTIGEAFLAIPQTFVADSARVVVSAKMGKTSVSLYILLKGKTLTAGAVTKYSINYDAHRGVQLWDGGPFWAPENVGADYPEEPGWFFSWGNGESCEPKNQVKYDDVRYKCDWTPHGSVTPLTYGFDIEFYYLNTAGGKLTANIDDAHDAATEIMGKGWRMPTKAEFDALVANTTQKQMKRGNQNGYLFTGKGAYARRSIFLPSTGYGNQKYYAYGNDMGTYWSRTIAEGTGLNVKAYRLQWNKTGESNGPTVETEGRAIGMNIRAVENF